MGEQVLTKEKFLETLRPIRVLALVPSLYDTSPGQRYRLEQWSPILEERGVEITYEPFEDEELHSMIYKPGLLGKKLNRVSRRFLRRLAAIRKVRDFDLVYVFREAALLGPAFFERLVYQSGIPMGFWYAIKHRLREISPILLFTSMLTLAYSLFQGNVGTAYRQRSQLLVFYFIFVAVGAVLLKERQEDRAREALKAKQDLADLQAARILARRRAPESQPTT